MIGNVVIEEGCAHWNIDAGKVNGFGRNEIAELEVLINSINEGLPSNIRVLSIESDKLSPGGKRIFCAGADQRERGTWPDREKLDHLSRQRQVIHLFRRIPVCVACFVDGLAIGLGVEICLASDFVFASSRSRFSFPEKSLGIVPGAGGYTWAHHWARHPREAQAWIESGSAIDAGYAQWLGVVDVCCEREDFALQGRGLTSRFLQMEPDKQVECKRKRLEALRFDQWFEEEQKAYADVLLNG